MPRNRLTALLATATLVPLAAVATATPGAGAQQAAAARPRPATPPRSRAPAHGIPHVTADDFGSLGFGSGYAAAETSICTLADTLVTARAQRSRWFGPDESLQRPGHAGGVEPPGRRLRPGPPQPHGSSRSCSPTRTAAPDRRPGRWSRGYVAGVNRYLDRVGPAGVGDPECRGAGYLRQEARPIDLWYGVYLANLLASSGVFVKEIVDADPPSPDDPGIPNPTASSVDRDELLAGLGRDPSAPFGSNATAVGGDATTTGKGMLLGNPHFPWRGRYRFTQQHLTIPGQYDVAGRLADRLPGGQHRVEQGRRVEPHRLDRLPVHALRVPPRRPHDVPHRQRPAGAAAP